MWELKRRAGSFLGDSKGGPRAGGGLQKKTAVKFLWRQDVSKKLIKMFVGG